MTVDLAKLTRLQSELEKVILDTLAVFIKGHPEADNARFVVSTFLSMAGRVGISHLQADATADLMETTAALIRKHGKKKLKDSGQGLH